MQKEPKLLLHKHERKNGSLVHIITLLYVSSVIYLKHTGLSIAFSATITLCSHLCNKAPQDLKISIGIYRFKCKIRDYSHIGQTGRSLRIRCREHIRYIKTDNPNSAYALDILNNRHAYGRNHGIARIMYKRTENELLGITFLCKPIRNRVY